MWKSLDRDWVTQLVKVEVNSKADWEGITLFRLEKLKKMIIHEMYNDEQYRYGENESSYTSNWYGVNYNLIRYMIRIVKPFFNDCMVKYREIISIQKL